MSASSSVPDAPTSPDASERSASPAPDLDEALPGTTLLPLHETGRANGNAPDTALSVSQLTPKIAQAAAGFQIQGPEPVVHRLLPRLRSRRPLDVYLKPVVWVKPRAEDPTPRAERAVDGIWETDDAPSDEPLPLRDLPSDLRSLVESINRRIAQIREAGSEEEGSLGLRLLRFMMTRGDTFRPLRTSATKDGFVYPQLEPLLEGTGRVVIPVLSSLAERGRLNGEFVTKRHACINCRSGFLNFVETCPDCGSAHLEADELVHHFRCAYTGPMWEYEQDDGPLSCPKCDRELHQIGVDYDKPSFVYACQQCANQFQEPTIRTDCYHCGHAAPPEQQIEETIQAYRVTAPGEQAALHGTGASFLSDLRQTTKVLDYSAFRVVLSTEAERVRRQKYTSSLLVVRLAGIYDVQSEFMRESSQEIIEEIARLFDEAADTSNYLGVHHSLFFFLLTDTAQDDATAEGRRLQQSVDQMLEGDLDLPLQLQMEAWPVNEDLDLDAVVQEFLSSRI